MTPDDAVFRRPPNARPIVTGPAMMRLVATASCVAALLAGSAPRAVPSVSPFAWLALVCVPLAFLVVTEAAYLHGRHRDRRPPRHHAGALAQAALLTLAVVTVLIGPGSGAVAPTLPTNVAYGVPAH